jgi:acetylornithine deacetylase/succinyl-diaminopimelate desuccinylase-like protein
VAGLKASLAAGLGKLKSPGDVGGAGGAEYMQPVSSGASAGADLASALDAAVVKKKKPSSGGGGGGTKVWEFDRSKVKQGNKVGEGNFGVVYAGVAKGVIPGETETKVAIKTLQSDSKEVESEFFQEVEIMKGLDGPFKIVRLLGVCTKASPLFMLMELMANGDLKTVLRKSRPKKSQASLFSLSKLGEMYSA